MSALDVAEYLRIRMKLMNMATTEASRRSDISRQTWHKLLRGEISDARLSTLVQVAETLEVPPMSLLRVYFDDSIPRPGRRKRHNNPLVAETCPDYTAVPANQAFTKTWEILNLSDTAWEGWQLHCMDKPMRELYQTSYRNRDVRYTLQPEADAIPIPTTPPGATAQVAVTFRAPKTTGLHASCWDLRDATGTAAYSKLTGLFCIVRVVAA